MINYRVLRDHYEYQDGTIKGVAVLWDPVIEHIWENYQEDHPPKKNKNNNLVQDFSSDEDENIDASRIVIRFSVSVFKKWLRKWQPDKEERNRLKFHDIVMICYNCAPGSSRYRKNMVVTTIEEQQPMLSPSQMMTHYKKHHPLHHQHCLYV